MKNNFLKESLLGFLYMLLFVFLAFFAYLAFSEEKEPKIGSFEAISEGMYLGSVVNYFAIDNNLDFGFSLGYSRSFRKGDLKGFWKVGGDVKWTSDFNASPIFTPSIHAEGGFIFGSFLPSLKVRMGLSDVYVFTKGSFGIDIEAYLGFSGIVFPEISSKAQSGSGVLVIGSYLGVKYHLIRGKIAPALELLNITYFI
ncbi:MAG: hypothetical protein ACRCYP_04315 [Alphaproteobacteria bacterium]